MRPGEQGGARAPAGLAPALEAKHEAVVSLLEGLGSVVVAYSGGVDSTLVLALAHEVLADRVLAATAVSDTYPDGELDGARWCADSLGVRLEEVHTKESEDERFLANPPDRCFYCKEELFRSLERLRAREGLAAIVDGTNAEDTADHRPGRRAALAAGVVSPLLEAGLSKREVRELSRALGLATWDKPAMPCLASRIPYGTPITPNRLAMVEAAERALAPLGLGDVRVRHHGTVARLEVAQEDIARAVQLRESIVAACRQAGFAYVALDLVGYRTGSLGETLSAEERAGARDGEAGRPR